MTSQGRSAGSVLCVVAAVLGMIAAVIMGVSALNATSGVSEQPAYDTDGEPNLFARPMCDNRDTPPDRNFLDCLSESESKAQEDAALWGARAAARQADVQAKGDLAIIFGLLGLTFAVGAVVFDVRSRSVP